MSWLWEILMEKWEEITNQAEALGETGLAKVWEAFKAGTIGSRGAGTRQEKKKEQDEKTAVYSRCKEQRRAARDVMKRAQAQS
ncbi:hypothetical protein ILUMI_14914 [Ignelater luminosus]|uniref:Uncharacterized protein n=1 Tax=Ignelater luminosus TaxID=2038154 RepID=A0A8K0CPN9_IGNLU|nr:hypothetical protein ILUMI_14914 [Ignelater luminosus]